MAKVLISSAAYPRKDRPRVELSETDFQRIENAGGVPLSEEARSHLQLLCEQFAKRMELSLAAPAATEVEGILRDFVEGLVLAERAWTKVRDSNDASEAARFWLHANWIGEYPLDDFGSELIFALHSAKQARSNLPLMTDSNTGRQPTFHVDDFLSKLEAVYEDAGGMVFTKFATALMRALPLHYRMHLANSEKALAKRITRMRKPKGQNVL